MSHEDLIAALTQAGQDPATINGLSDDQLRNLYTQVLGGAGASAMTDPKKPGLLTWFGRSLIGSTKRFKGQKSNMSDRQSLRSAQKLHVFAEQEYRRMKRQSAERRKQDAKAFCDRLVAEGRATPTLKQTVLMPLLLTLDDSAQVWQFSEGGVTKTMTAYEVKKAQLAKGPVIVRMGERLPSDPASRKAGAAAEVNKVEKFCEMYGDKLKVHGVDAKKTIDLAKKKAATDSNFKAASLIGEDAARMVG